ncbi:alpha/beta hydrolase family protein [Hymenobacter wooponensis]|uniref:Alpha/beta fold hydrolase n=1 Tax=Hymenobacter wooponensis TaxID=1525360 RepID=A0A4Z0MDV5_9BACT|nr:alpha/beta fold hydrolase [Hymenobacter wooponensis]TGD77649.1 alpha/beta fold hydrolase [Hymenobacter wooponensis]
MPQPTPASPPVVSFSPVVLPVPGRQVDLHLKVSAPAAGDNLPILLLSHGHGQSTFLSSFRGYGPLADFYAAEGFAVVQPTHQDSKALGLDPNGPEGPLFWSSRAEDMRHIIDQLDHLEATVPGLSGRLDRARIAVLGHSMGGHTVALLAGMRVTNPVDGQEVDLAEPRITARVLLAPPGDGADLAAFAAEHYRVLGATRFEAMSMPALVVVGDKDQSARFSDRDDWRADAYHRSPGAKCLLTVFGGEHILGGISGYDAAETTDESPERVAFVRETVLAYLRTALNPADASWEATKERLQRDAQAKGRIECKN